MVYESVKLATCALASAADHTEHKRSLSFVVKQVNFSNDYNEKTGNL